MVRTLIASLIVIFISVSVLTKLQTKKAPHGVWHRVEKGLEVAEFLAPEPSDIGDSRITVVRIDPAEFTFDLFLAAEKGGRSRTIDQWCNEFKLTAAINAGMFQADGLTNVGYMKHRGKILNGNLVKNYNAFLLMHPLQAGLVPVQIVDRTCVNPDSLLGSYGTAVQNLRMISCQGRNVGSKSQKRWSTVAAAQDKHGNILFLFSRSPFPVHTFINNLLRLPLDIGVTMYLEGGPEASLCVKTPDTLIVKYGSFETNFLESDSNASPWAIPNVIGIRPKK